MHCTASRCYIQYVAITHTVYRCVQKSGDSPFVQSSPLHRLQESIAHGTKREIKLADSMKNEVITFHLPKYQQKTTTQSFRKASANTIIRSSRPLLTGR